MTEIKTITPNWQEDTDPHRYRERLKTVKNLTAGCPCDRCVSRSTCAYTGHECAGYLRWVSTGSSKERKG